MLQWAVCTTPMPAASSGFLAAFLQGNCRSINLKGMQGQRSSGYMKITIPLANMYWYNGGWWQSSASDFNGCGGDIGAWDINQVEFK